jgi:hypothetical protein
MRQGRRQQQQQQQQQRQQQQEACEHTPVNTRLAPLQGVPGRAVGVCVAQSWRKYVCREPKRVLPLQWRVESSVGLYPELPGCLCFSSHLTWGWSMCFKPLTPALYQLPGSRPSNRPGRSPPRGRTQLASSLVCRPPSDSECGHCLSPIQRGACFFFAPLWQLSCWHRCLLAGCMFGHCGAYHCPNGLCPLRVCVCTPGAVPCGQHLPYGQHLCIFHCVSPHQYEFGRNSKGDVACGPRALLPTVVRQQCCHCCLLLQVPLVAECITWWHEPPGPHGGGRGPGIPMGCTCCKYIVSELAGQRIGCELAGQLICQPWVTPGAAFDHSSPSLWPVWYICDVKASVSPQLGQDVWVWSLCVTCEVIQRALHNWPMAAVRDARHSVLTLHVSLKPSGT